MKILRHLSILTLALCAHSILAVTTGDIRNWNLEAQNTTDISRLETLRKQLHQAGASGDARRVETKIGNLRRRMPAPTTTTATSAPTPIVRNAPPAPTTTTTTEVPAPTTITTPAGTWLDEIQAAHVLANTHRAKTMSELAPIISTFNDINSSFNITNANDLTDEKSKKRYDAIVRELDKKKLALASTSEDFDTWLKNITPAPSRTLIVEKAVELNGLYGVDAVRITTELANLTMEILEIGLKITEKTLDTQKFALETKTRKYASLVNELSLINTQNKQLERTLNNDGRINEFNTVNNLTSKPDILVESRMSSKINTALGAKTTWPDIGIQAILSIAGLWTADNGANWSELNVDAAINTKLGLVYSKIELGEPYTTLHDILLNYRAMFYNTAWSKAGYTGSPVKTMLKNVGTLAAPYNAAPIASSPSEPAPTTTTTSSTATSASAVPETTTTTIPAPTITASAAPTGSLNEREWLDSAQYLLLDISGAQSANGVLSEELKTTFTELFNKTNAKYGVTANGANLDGVAKDLYNSIKAELQ